MKQFFTPLLVFIVILATTFGAQAQRINTYAGNGTTGYTGDGAAATGAEFGPPGGVTEDNSGNIYIADPTNHVVRMVNTSGIISTFAGTGTPGASGDGGMATAATLNSPNGLVSDISGNIYISDAANNSVRMVNTSGIISLFAGSGAVLGDGGFATVAALSSPAGLAADGAGNLYIADKGHSRIRIVSSAGIISTFAGTGVAGSLGDGGYATSAEINLPTGVAVDPSGDLFIASVTEEKIRKVNSFGTISTIAGTGIAGFTGDGTPATSAELNSPVAVATDGSGNVYISDQNNNRIRMVNVATGIISTVAGDASAGFTGDLVAPTATGLSNPDGVFVDGSNNIFISDQLDFRERIVTPPCSILPSGGTAVTNENLVCATTPFTVSISGATVSISGDLTYQWQMSPDGTTFSNIPGATDTFYTGTEGGSRFYLCDVTCPSLGTGASSNVEVNFSLLCYCSPFYSYAAYSCSTYGINIALYEIVGELATNITDNTSCNSTGYIDQTSMSVTLYQGVTYNNTILCGGTYYAPAAQAWIDFNNDGVFAGSESVGGTNSFTNVTGSFTSAIPSGSALGAHRMRIVTSYGDGSYPTMDPCTAGYLYGESRDYTVNIAAPPGCSGAPTAGTVVAPYSVCLSNPLSLDLTGETIASGLGYQWQSSSDSATWANISGATTVPYSSTVSSTLYYRCIVTCISSGLLDKTPGVKVLYSAFCYCTPSYSAASSACSIGINIQEFKVVGEAASTLDDVAACDGSGYKDETALTAVNLMQSNTYSSTVTSSSTGYNINAQVWIDFNDDGTFETSETVGGVNFYLSSSPISLVIPATATTGTHRMRIVTEFNGDGFVYPSLDSCPSSSVCTYGETRDYTVNILALPACSGTPVAGTVSGTGSVCITSGYTLNLTGTSTGTGLTFQWQSSADTISWSNISGATTTTLTGTESSTTYYRCVVFCSAGGTGQSSAFLVNYSATCYCIPSYSSGLTSCSTLGTTISQYKINGASGTSINDVAACNGTGYEDKTLLSVTLAESSTYTTSIYYTSGSVTMDVQAWIDFNDNGTFEGSETVGGMNAYSSPGSLVVSIPAAAPLGSHRMRIVTSQDGLGFTYPTMDPCTSGYSIGDARDYSVTIIGPVCSGTPTAGSISATVSTGCSPFSTTMSLTGATATGGIQYQWQSSPDNVTFTAVGGATSTSYTTTISSNVYYNCVVTCSISASSATASSLSFTAISAPVVAPITGGTTFCQGATSTLNDGTSGGTWSSTNTAVARVNSSGMVTGVSGGTSTINYAVSNACGTTTVNTTVTIDTAPAAGAISGPSTTCLGSSVALSETVSGGSWTSGTVSVATIDGSGNVFGVTLGSSNITYTVSNACGSNVATYAETVTATASAGSISGPTTVCSGNTITLTETVGGGTWSSGSTGVATVAAGIVSGVSGGSAIISYTVSGGCTPATATYTVTVITTPAGGAISGPTVVCVGSSITLSETSSGGSWTTSSSSLATVDASGVVTGIASGSPTVFYTVSNSCGSAGTSYAITVNPAPYAGTITGTAGVCTGHTTTLSDAASGGSWSSSNTSVATVTSGGVVSGVSGGTATIFYSVTNSCGTAFAADAVTVTPFPSAGTITGPTNVCLGSPVTFSDTVSGGTWMSGNTSVATVNSSGLVTGVATGVVDIYYFVSNACGSTNVTVTTHVLAPPSAGSITGATSICQAASSALSTSVSGGSWSSSDTAVATVNTSGIVSGIRGGTAVITYAVTNPCGTAITTAFVTINPLPVVGPITGSTSFCVGVANALSDTAGSGSGTWTSSNIAVATISSTGVVSPITAGSATITYSLTNSCGTTRAATGITVTHAPVSAGSISGMSHVCPADSITLTDTTSGGVWSSGNVAIATVNAAGHIFGVTAGSVGITYTITNACGTIFTDTTITVNPGITAGSISVSSTSVCAGTTATATDGISGGTWASSDTTIATVNSSGLISGVSYSGGSATISYTVTNSCGTATATAVFNVLPAPALSTISGSSPICQGTSSSFSDTYFGGTWSSSNTSIATVVASTGVVHAVAAGTATISYVASNVYGCSTTKLDTITVNPAPVSGSLSGTTTTVCANASIVFTDGSAGGTWSSTDTYVATVDASGHVYGVASGDATISYTVTNSCGTAATSVDVTVDPSPILTDIFGPGALCTGVTYALSNTTFGGVWSSSNSSIASIDASSGMVTGISAGSATITYEVTNVFGCSDTVTTSETVNPSASAGTLAVSTTTICTGISVSFSDATSGGVWSSSDSAVASVDTSGNVTGVTPGFATISYTVSNIYSCNSTVSASVTINPSPAMSPITGATSLCLGSTTALHDATSGGVWSSDASSVASVNSSTGVVTGISLGSTMISYSITNVYGCTSADSIVDTVSAIAVAGTISGPTIICTSASSAFSETASGGTWSTSNTAIATADASGNIYGISAGVVDITYMVATSLGCSATAIQLDTVDLSPSVDTIVGTPVICVGVTVAFTEATAGGFWGSSSANANVDATGNVSGVSAGIDTVSYEVTDGLGCMTKRLYGISVNPSPVLSAISGSTDACLGSTTALTDTATTGSWSTSNMTAATIDASTGVLTAIALGMDTVYYSSTNGFGCSTKVSAVETVRALPVVASVTGTTNVCAGLTTRLSDDSTGGVWSSTNMAVATVSTSGVVTSVAAGTVNILYTITNAYFCSKSDTLAVTVNPIPVVGAITGMTSVCIGGSTMLTDTTTSGRWSTGSGSVATVTLGGTVTGLSVGSAIITYTVTSAFACVATATATVAVSTLPTVAAISGLSTLCPGAMDTLTDAETGGTWTSGGTGIATIDGSTGVVYGVSGGSVTISYTIAASAGCTAFDTMVVTVEPIPSAGVISGASSSVCLGLAELLSDATSGGAWSSSDTAVARITGSGIVTGETVGSSTITYSVMSTFGCRNHTTFAITVNPLPAGTLNPTGGSATLCHGNPVRLDVTGTTGTPTYQWSNGGSAITGATSSTYSADSTGNYTVQITEGGCSATLTGSVNVIAPPVAVIAQSSDTLTATGGLASYQWLRDGVVIPGATSSTYFVTDTGSYSVLVGDANGCTDTSTSKAIDSVTTGIANVNVLAVSWYPNPARSEIKISAPVRVNVAILSTDGKMVIRKDEAISVDVSNLANGLYLIMIYDTNNNLLKADKFIKEE